MPVSKCSAEFGASSGRKMKQKQKTKNEKSNTVLTPICINDRRN